MPIGSKSSRAPAWEAVSTATRRAVGSRREIISALIYSFDIIKQPRTRVQTRSEFLRVRSPNQSLCRCDRDHALRVKQSPSSARCLRSRANLRSRSRSASVLTDCSKIRTRWKIVIIFDIVAAPWSWTDVRRTAPQFGGRKFMDTGAIAVPIAGVRFGHSTSRRRGNRRPPPRKDLAQTGHAPAGDFDNRTTCSSAPFNQGCCRLITSGSSAIWNAAPMLP